MGEIKGGEGGTRRVTTDLIARAIARQAQNDEREVAQIKVQFLTEGLYAVEIYERGIHEPEAFFLNVADEGVTRQD